MSKSVNPQLLNGLTLAYMGDAAYELAIREHLIRQGQTKPNVLHKMATHYVSAKAQAYLVNKMIEEAILTDEEMTYFKRGRNAKSHTKAKNVDTKTYSHSTGFESLMGFLYLSRETKRLEDLIQWCVEEIEKR